MRSCFADGRPNPNVKFRSGMRISLRVPVEVFAKCVGLDRASTRCGALSSASPHLPLVAAPRCSPRAHGTEARVYRRGSPACFRAGEGSRKGKCRFRRGENNRGTEQAQKQTLPSLNSEGASSPPSPSRTPGNNWEPGRIVASVETRSDPEVA